MARVTFRLTDALIESIVAHAAREGISPAAKMRQLIEQGLEPYQQIDRFRAAIERLDQAWSRRTDRWS